MYIVHRTSTSYVYTMYDVHMYIVRCTMYYMLYLYAIIVPPPGTARLYDRPHTSTQVHNTPRHYMTRLALALALVYDVLCTCTMYDVHRTSTSYSYDVPCTLYLVRVRCTLCSLRCSSTINMYEYIVLCTSIVATLYEYYVPCT